MPQRTGRRQKTAGRGSKKPGKEKPKRQEDVKRSSMRASSYQGPRTGQTGNGKRDGSTERVRGIIQKYLEPEREREREIQRKKKEIMASKARREKNRREIKESAISRTPRVSYVRKPFGASFGRRRNVLGSCYPGTGYADPWRYGLVQHDFVSLCHLVWRHFFFGR